jgi:two-component system, chemotaxis family, sensor kinase CheA
MMGFAEMNELIHTMEEVLKDAAGRHYALSAGAVDALLVSGDALLVISGARAGAAPNVAALHEWLNGSLTPIEQNAPSPVPAAPPRSVALDPYPIAESTVKLTTEHLNRLSNAVTGVAQRVRARELLDAQRRGVLRELKAIGRLADEMGQAGEDVAQRLARLRDVFAEMNRQTAMIGSADLGDLTQLQTELEQVRLSPVATLFETTPRLVRELSKDLKREVDLVIEGEQARVDRKVLEALREPLLHLIRNAIDHGIEMPEERRKAGKPSRATLRVSAAREADRLLLKVSDDGRGLVREEIMARAQKQGFVDSAVSLDESETYELLFRAGFSTREVASDVSGRGVGLDAVRASIHALGGEIEVSSTPKKGTTFVLRVPVTLSASSVVFVRAGRDEIGLPAAQILRAATALEHEISNLAGKPMLAQPEGSTPFASLGALLGNEPMRPPLPGEIYLLLRGRGQTAAVGVDALLEERLQPLLPVQGLLKSALHVASAALRADGFLRLVLSVPEVVGAVWAQVPLAIIQMHNPKVRRRALVVDDSPLTRELLVTMMESAHFEVIEAADGLIALKQLQTFHFEVVVSDLEMPHMDGIELAKAIKSDPKLKKLPVILVTTRGSDEDKRRGLDAGADAYITKSEMVRRDLLETVARLVD